MQETAIATSPALAATDNKPTSIFIAAKQDYAVEGMVRILGDSASNQVVACIEPGDACWDKLRNLQPDVLLVHHQSVVLPKRELFTKIKETAPGVGIIVFGQGMEDDFLLEIVRAGAVGYINERMNSGDLIEAVQAVRNGQLWMERRLLEALARTAIEFERTLENSIVERLDTVRKILTRRETTVFQLVLEGLTTKEIAERMYRSEQSIKLHLGRIFKKFEVTSRSQLIVQAYSKICPVQNVVRLIRFAFDARRTANEDDDDADGAICSTSRSGRD
jgi:DNA-binding NarL/FixJ family response regulator